MSSSEQLVSRVFEEYKELANENINLVPEPSRSLIVVYTAQGVICNGGFNYFFQSDFEGYSGYGVVSDSFRKIGLIEHANSIDSLLNLFPNHSPHENLMERAEFLLKYFDVESDDFLPGVGIADELFFKNHRSPYEKAIDYYLSSTSEAF